MNRRPLTEAKRLKIMKALALRPHTYEELQAIVDLAHPTVAKYIRELRRMKTVFVAEYRRDGATRGRDTLAFAWGNRADVPPPPSLTPAERMAKTRARRKSET